MIEDLLNRFDPDGDVLLRAISAHVSDEMLECISRADYGIDADKHFAALHLLRDDLTFPENPVMVPMEVLELMRWDDPVADIRPGKTAEFGHWMMVFSCAAILRAVHEPWNYKGDGSTDSTTIQLILSLEALPVDLNHQAAANFAWLILNSEPEGMNDSIREYGVALLWFALHLSPRLSDDDLIALAQWVLKRADELKWNRSLAEFSGLKQMVITCQRRSEWEIFAVKFAEIDLSDRSADLPIWVRLLAEQLVD
jgi:hypothetical protein